MGISTISFPNTFDNSSKNVKLVSGKESIEQCLSLLLTSAKGELLGDPAYGTKLMSYIYNYNNDVLAELVRSEIIKAIQIYENRITVYESDISVVDEVNTVKINITYYIKDEDTYSTFTLALEREDNNYGY
jgi:phage baseplate assembly protein W